MSKHFIVSPSPQKVSKEILDSSMVEHEFLITGNESALKEKNKKKIQEQDSLIHTLGRIIVKADMNFKNSHRFKDGTTIRLERAYNNFNRRETQPINCIVVSGEDVPSGSDLLVDHNAFHETNRINDYKNKFEHEGSDDVRYFSIPLSECFAYRADGDVWKPMPNFDFALRVFKPYSGTLQNIEPEIVTDVLYVTSGVLKGNVVKTLKACDYCIVFQGDDGTESQIIVFRPFGNEKLVLEPEAIAILHDLTDEVEKGKLLLGLTKTKCYPINERGKFIHQF